MSKHTKKVGISGRFGARFGASLRKKYNQIQKTYKKLYKCQFCISNSVKKFKLGIWKCYKCNTLFTGAAFVYNNTKIKF